MSGDLVERLRDQTCDCGCLTAQREEAAAEIEGLRQALEKIADLPAVRGNRAIYFARTALRASGVA